MITGLRMNHAYIRPGGVAQDLPEGAIDEDPRVPRRSCRKRLDGVRQAAHRPADLAATGSRASATSTSTGCLALGVTGPILRSAGPALGPAQGRAVLRLRDLRLRGADRRRPPTCYGRYLVRVAEMHESLKIVEQALDRLEPGPVMVEDTKIAWPAQLSLGADGMGNSLEHVRKIMGQSMESLIHHFKLVTEGFRVPAGPGLRRRSSRPRGELGCHVVSDGGTRPYRVHVRDPSFVNLQAMPAMAEGGLIADVIAAVASHRPGHGWV